MPVFGVDGFHPKEPHGVSMDMLLGARLGPPNFGFAIFSRLPAIRFLSFLDLFSWFSGWISECHPLKGKLLAGDLRAAQFWVS